MKVKICDIYDPQDNIDKITNIYGVEETEINNCVQIIMAENNNIPIQNIYYSRFDHILHFKADKQLSITNWLKFQTETEINSLLQQDIKDGHYLRLYDDKFKYTHKINGMEDFINLYDLNQIVLKTHQEYKDLLSSFNEELAGKYGNIEIEFFVGACIEAIKNKDYKYKLPIRIGNQTLYLSKNTDDFLVKIYKRNEDYSLAELNREDIQSLNINIRFIYDLSYMYDELMNYAPFFFEEEYFKPLINSKMIVDITPWSISISTKHIDAFQLRFSRVNKYQLKGETAKIMDTKIVDKEDLIFKKAFISIGNCPIYFKKVIYDIVNEKLEQQDKNILVRKLKQ